MPLNYKITFFFCTKKNYISFPSSYEKTYSNAKSKVKFDELLTCFSTFSRNSILHFTKSISQIPCAY